MDSPALIEDAQSWEMQSVGSEKSRWEMVIVVILVVLGGVGGFCIGRVTVGSLSPQQCLSAQQLREIALFIETEQAILKTVMSGAHWSNASTVALYRQAIGLLERLRTSSDRGHAASRN